MPIGKNVAIMGGNIQGCQTAEFLVRRGRKVSIVETEKEMGAGLLESLVKPHLLIWLDEKGVPMTTEAKYDQVTEKGLVITTKEGKKQTIDADTVLTTLPLQADNRLLKEIEVKVPEVYAIGDCRAPGMIVDAIADGAKVGRMV